MACHGQKVSGMVNYPERWNQEEQRWEDGFTPDRGEIFTRFRDEVRSIILNEETDIISIGMHVEYSK